MNKSSYRTYIIITKETNYSIIFKFIMDFNIIMYGSSGDAEKIPFKPFPCE